MNNTKSQPLVGYPGLVWCSCYNSLQWLQGLLLSATVPAQTVTAGAQATFQTFRNGINAVAAFQTAQALAGEAVNLQAILNMALTLDAQTRAYATARVNGTLVAANQMAKLPPTIKPFAASGMLAAGQPAIADPGFLEWCMGFTGEVAPTLTVSGITACVNQELLSWLNVANAVLSAQGAPYTDYRYDAALRTWRTSSRIASMLNGFTSGPFASGAIQQNTKTLTWNNLVALPSMMLSASSLMSAPISLGNQQASVVRFNLTAIANQLAILLLSLRSPGAAAPGLATLNVGQSLQDLAAQETGNFENWTSIVAANGLQPPYPNASNTSAAVSGLQLLIPTVGSVFVSGTSTASYFANVLGTDWDFGPINPPPSGQISPWLGEIPLITGYLNFARALGRRIQTPVGTLIYHTNYGSRIPPEVGAVQGADEAPRLKQLGDSAINSDPRTGSILASTATTQPGFLATYSATVQPIGPGTKPVNVNATIAPVA